MLLLRYLTVLCYITLCSGGNTPPGFRFQVTQKGIDYGRNVVLPILTDAIKTAQIPDIAQRVDTPLGHVHFSLSSIKIHSVDISQTAVSLKAPSNVVATITNANIHLHANWHYREDSWPHIEDSGSVDLSASSISIGVNILVDTTSTGEPHVRTHGCTFAIGRLDVTFHGGASWLYNLFSDSIADGIKDSISGQVCPVVTDELNNDLNSVLATVDLHSDIDDFCSIDYSLIEPPFVIKDALFVNGKGEIFSRAHPTECPSPKQTLPETVDSAHMVTLWITEYMLNTAGYAYQDSQFLQYNLTSADIPEEVPIKMNTNYFKFFIPELHTAYPDKNLTLWLYVTKPVLFEIRSAGVSGRAEGTITWFVDNSTDNSSDSSTLVEVFKLNVQLDLCVNISVQLGAKSEIYLDIITVEPYIQLNSTNIGPFSLSSLDAFVKLSRSLIVPFINGLIHNGIPLPTFQDILFSGFDFTLQDGYIQIHTDVKYAPTNTLHSEHYTLFSDTEFTCKMQDPLASWLHTLGQFMFGEE